MMALLIWINSYFIHSYETAGFNYVRFILIILDYTLIFFALTLTNRLEKERQTIKRIEIEKKKAIRAEEEEQLIKESEKIIGKLKSHYEESQDELTFPELVQMMMFTNTSDLPHKMMPNKDFHEELNVLHPTLEKIFPVASKLKGATNLQKYNNNSTLNKMVYEFFSDRRVSEHYGLPGDTNYVENPLIKLLRGSSKGFRGEDRLEKELRQDFKNHSLFFNLHLSDGNEKIELDALMIIGNNVVAFEGKHYSADKILFEANGQAKIFNGKRIKILDVVSQMNRHHNVLQHILGENIKVYSMFVPTDKKTLVQNSFKNKYFRVAYIDSVGFMVKEMDLKPDELSESIIYNLIKESQIADREFNSVDLEFINNELRRFANDEKYDNMMSLEYARILDLAPLNKADNNVFKIKENDVIYKEIYDIILDNYKGKRDQ